MCEARSSHLRTDADPTESAAFPTDVNNVLARCALTDGRDATVRTTDQTTHIVGDHAIVRHTFTGETARDGKTNPVTIGVLMVWHTQNGAWKRLARQAVRREEGRTNRVKPFMLCPPAAAGERRLDHTRRPG
jgi:hypothetical protein